MMLRNLRYTLLMLVSLLAASGGWTQTAAPAPQAAMPPVRVSLITCYPGDEVYQLFGHTAIRVQAFIPDTIDVAHNDSVIAGEAIDLAYNYGAFSFSTDNFVYKFVAGQTDYVLDVEHFADFMVPYRARGSKVVEQELNLAPEECRALIAALDENARPENRRYRYNFLYDNCSTRPRDMVEKFLCGSLTYGSEAATPSFREMIHHYGANYSWFLFGIDLALGAELDRPATWREQMFIPMVLQQAYNQAEVSLGNDSIEVLYPLVLNETTLYDPQSSPVLPPTPWYLSPLFVALLLLLAAVVVTYLDRQYQRVTCQFDTVFYGVCFVLSLIIYFLIFVSEHPATTVNYHALWLSPLCIIPATMAYVRPLRRVVRLFHFVNLVALALFLLTAVTGLQHYNIAVYPLVAVSVLRSLHYILIYPVTTRTYKPSSLHRNE